MACIQEVSWQQRSRLTQGWELLRTAPGAATSPGAVEQLPGTWMSAEVPGTLASALRLAGRWDPDAPQDLDAEDVWYRLRFRRTEQAERAALRFDGLATVSEAWLNGQPLLASRSMWQQHRVEVGPLLGADNVLHLRFSALAPLLAERRPRPRWKTRLVSQQQLRWWRTSFLGRIPGWTPPAAPVGPFRPVILEEGNGPTVSQAQVRVRLQADTGVLELRLGLVGRGGATTGARLLLGELTAPLEVRQATDGTAELAGAIRVAEVERWWPHTHGAPSLYPLSVELPALGAIELAPVGFRSIEAETADGGFALRVNGERVFCRGACWTPVDVVAVGASEERQQTAVELARNGGMNMLRVCGPFAYEDDAFHDACDAAGLLVWQDFMFANLDYPADDAAFLATVKAEAESVVARLGWRASTAVFCGNSEVEQQASMLGLPADLWRSPLFSEVLPAVVRAGCELPYVPSSPSSGVLPFQPGEGVAHYYGVGAYRRPLEDARRADVRFATECLAFSNVPDARTVSALGSEGLTALRGLRWKARVPRDRGAEWDFEDIRDFYLGSLFGVDADRLRADDPERYLALGRVATAEVMSATFAEWRRHGSRCAGGLVWFLRDLWPGAGWGVIDSGGRPKAPYWALRRAFSPRAVFLTDEGTNGLAVHLVNDGARTMEGHLRIALYRDGQIPVVSGTQLVQVEPRSSVRVWAEGVLGAFVDVGRAFRFGPPEHDLVVAAWSDAAGRALAPPVFHFPLGRPSRVDPELRLEMAVAQREGCPVLELRANRFAQSVSLELEGALPEDDFFHLEPGVPHAVALRRVSGAPEPRGTARPLNAAASTRFGGWA